MTYRRIVQACFALALLLSQGAFATTIILGEPNNVTSFGGASSYPFYHDNPNPGGNTVYQQVYEKSLFPESLTIRRILFPVYTFAAADPAAQYEVLLSYTNKQVNALTHDYASNLGAGLGNINNPGAQPTPHLVYSGPINPTSEYLEFFDAIPSVYYNQFNLLLEIRKTGGQSFPLALRSTAFMSNPGFSSIHNFNANMGPYQNYGLMTMFSDEVPEPGTYALLGLGIGALWVARRYRRRGAAR